MWYIDGFIKGGTCVLSLYERMRKGTRFVFFIAFFLGVGGDEDVEFYVAEVLDVNTFRFCWVFLGFGRVEWLYEFVIESVFVFIDK